MKELTIVLLILIMSFGCSVPAATKLSNVYYPNTFKGGLLITQNINSARVAVLAVEGNYEYYLQYIKFKLNYKKVEEEQDQKKEIVSSSCTWVPWL